MIEIGDVVYYAFEKQLLRGVVAGISNDGKGASVDFPPYGSNVYCVCKIESLYHSPIPVLRKLIAEMNEIINEATRNKLEFEAKLAKVMR